MKKLKIICLLIMVLGLGYSLYLHYSTRVVKIDGANPEKYVGTYKLTKTNYIEKRVLLIKYKLRRTFFNDERAWVFYLKEDFKQRFVVYKNEEGIITDSLVREGTWEIKNDSLLLHFPEDRFQPTMVRLGLRNRFCYLGTIYDCKDQTKEIGKEFTILQKVN